MIKSKRGRKLGKTTCRNCGCEFEKPISEIKRNEKKGRNNFCSRVCVGKYSKHWRNENGNYHDLTQYTRKDEYTKFRYHYRNIKKRDKEVTVTLEDLKKVWENQNGICPFTGYELTLSTYTNTEKNILNSASLDRIDSNVGYTPTNVRWVSRGINLMKSDRTDDEVWEVCKMIYENYKKINHPD